MHMCQEGFDLLQMLLCNIGHVHHKPCHMLVPPSATSQVRKTLLRAEVPPTCFEETLLAVRIGGLGSHSQAMVYTPASLRACLVYCFFLQEGGGG